MTQDQVFVPKTRSELKLPAFNPSGEDRFGYNVSEEVKKELWEALGDSPIGATLACASYLVWLFYFPLCESFLNEYLPSLEVGLRILLRMLLVSGITQRAPTVGFFPM